MNKINDIDDSEWTVIVKQKKPPKDKTSSIKYIPTKTEIIKKLSYFKRYNPFGLFICGSVARGTNNEYSDLDILVIWKGKIPSNIIELRNEIEYIVEMNVDLVSLIYKGKLMLDTNIENITDKNMIYLNNVIIEAIAVIGSIYDIYLSEYILKV
jgi:predicted nucleotidyltransferase